jgi:hypothetical protein
MVLLKTLALADKFYFPDDREKQIFIIIRVRSKKGAGTFKCCPIGMLRGLYFSGNREIIHVPNI